MTLVKLFRAALKLMMTEAGWARVEVKRSEEVATQFYVLTKGTHSYAQIAKNTLRKSERMNIRISRADLNRIKAKAAEEGIPYQTLVASIIHKYVSGYLKSA